MRILLSLSSSTICFYLFAVFNLHLNATFILFGDLLSYVHLQIDGVNNLGDFIVYLLVPYCGLETISIFIFFTLLFCIGIFFGPLAPLVSLIPIISLHFFTVLPEAISIIFLLISLFNIKRNRTFNVLSFMTWPPIIVLMVIIYFYEFKQFITFHSLWILKLLLMFLVGDFVFINLFNSDSIILAFYVSIINLVQHHFSLVDHIPKNRIFTLFVLITLHLFLMLQFLKIKKSDAIRLFLITGFSCCLYLFSLNDAFGRYLIIYGVFICCLILKCVASGVRKTLFMNYRM
jgi:hypothetical protein